MCSSGFLVGPCQQVKLMMKPVRRVAAIIYLGMMIIVLGVAIGVSVTATYLLVRLWLRD